jgi:hypothetical protein
VLISTNNLVTESGGVQIGAADPGAQNTPVVSPNIASELRNAGYSFGGYAQNLPFVGSQVFENNNNGANYARRHVPWTNSQDNAWIDDTTPSPNGFPNTLPRSVSMPFTDSPFDDPNPDFSTLPTFSLIIPDDDFNMHDGSVNAGDTWLRNNLDAYYQWAKTHNSLLIVTWDESSQSVYNPSTGIGNLIPTIFAGAFVKPGNNATPRTHLNILRTIEGMYDLRTNPANAGNLTPLESDSGSMAGPAISGSRMIDDVWANLPTGLVADAVSFTQVDLTWLDYTPNETGHAIERSTDGGAFVEISNTVPANATSFSDTSVTAGHVYSYRVRAFTDPGPVYTPYSNTATTSTTTPNAPTLLETSQAGFSTIGLTWTDNANNENGFQVERSATGNAGDFTLLATVGPNITAFNDQTAGEGNTWHYRVKAHNGLGDSAYTNNSSTTIPNANPNAILAAPVDNSPIDGNVAVGSLLVSPQTNFKVLLTDIGSDINDASVVSAAVTLTKDSGSGPVMLVNGTDYTFNYASGTNLITVLPTSFSFGVGTYVLTLNPNIISDNAATPHYVSSKQYTIVIEASPPLIFPTPLTTISPQGSQVATGAVSGMVNGPTIAILQGGTTFTEPTINASAYEGSAAELGFITNSLGTTATTATQIGVQSSSTNAVAQTAFTTAPTAGKVYMVRNTSSSSAQTLVHTVTFSPVTLAPSDTNQLSINVFLGNDNSPGGSTYETASTGGPGGGQAQDYIKITIDAVDNNNVHSLLTVLDTQAGNQDLDVLAMAGTLVKGGWKTIVTPIGQEFVSAQLIIEAANNSSQGNEVYAFDKIAFASTIPNAQSAVNYTIDLNAGDHVTLVAHPDEPALQPFVEFSGPGLSSVGATASAANRDAVLQNAAVPGTGTYTISIGTANSISGEYTLRLLVNSLVEREAHNGPTNNTQPSAQSIEAGFANLGGGVSRAAVAGTAETAEGSVLEYMGHIFTLHNGHYYGATNTPGSWVDKEAEAVSIGAHLVTINDAAENAFLVTNFGNGNRWIGLTDQAVEGTFVWSSGEPVTYTNWGFGQPDNRNNEDYGVLGGSFFGQAFWTDSRSNNNVGIIELTSVPPAPGQDLYALNLEKDQSIALVASAGVNLEIQDDEGAVLAAGVLANGRPRLAGFLAPFTGTYYVRVTGGASSVDYNLALVKGASFDSQTGEINFAPTNVNAGSAYFLTQGSSVTLGGSASNAEASDVLFYFWDVNGDGIFGDLTGQAPTLTWAKWLDLGMSSDPGAASVKVRVEDGQGNIVTSTAAPLTIVDGTPRVMSVHVGSSAWVPAVQDLLSGPSGAGAGYLMPTGNDQARPLPWSNLNQVSITFSENVGVAPTDLRLIGVAASAPPAITHYDYDFPTRTATWTLAGSLTSNRLQFVLDDRASDSAGHVLDGEWTDNVSNQSGNGVAGGDFTFAVNVLPGDVDGDGSVTTADVTAVRLLVPSSTASSNFNLRADLDGSGSVTTADVTSARLKVGTTLPAAPAIQATVAKGLSTSAAAASPATAARSRAFEYFGAPTVAQTLPSGPRFIGPLLPSELSSVIARALSAQAMQARQSPASATAAKDLLFSRLTSDLFDDGF